MDMKERHNDRQHCLQSFGLLILIALFLCVGCSGCVSPTSIANEILEAPNKHIRIPNEFQQLGMAVSTNFPVKQVAVGPPPATLDLMVMEPGDYHVQMSSTFTLHPPQGPREQRRYDFHLNYGLADFSRAPKPERAHGAIFLLPGYGLDKEAMMPWGFVLANAGYQVILVDLRGNGHSTGDQIFFGGIERTDMVQCLDTLLKERVCSGPVGALGVSYGAALALQWAAIDPRVQSVAVISPYLNTYIAVDRYLKTFTPDLTWKTDRKVATDVANRLSIFEDLDTETAVRRIRHPILFIRTEHDEVCFREDLSRLQAAAVAGSKVKEIPLANHLLIGFCISQLGDTVAEWFRSQLQ